MTDCPKGVEQDVRAESPQISFPRFVNPFANYPPPHPPPPPGSLKVLFGRNRSQMEIIRPNRFHLPALLLSLRGDTPSPFDISSRWTITERSSITFRDDSRHPEMPQKSLQCAESCVHEDPSTCEVDTGSPPMAFQKHHVSKMRLKPFHQQPLGRAQDYTDMYMHVTVNT